MKGMKKYQQGGMSMKDMAVNKMIREQGDNDRLDESMGARNGPTMQGMKARRDESKGMERSSGRTPYSGDKAMPRMKKGGWTKCRGAGCATKGVRAAKMVTMNGRKAMPVWLTHALVLRVVCANLQNTMDPPTGLPMPEEGSLPPRRRQRAYPCTTAASNAATPEVQVVVGGGGRNAGGKIGADKAGGKVRGAGCATKGTRAAKMVNDEG